MSTSIDKILFYWYCLFAFVALFFEPLYYFGCSWDGVNCPAAATSPLISYTKDLWMIYAQWDPMFLIVPLWLRVLCSIEVFLFGPLYLAVAVGMVKDADWLFPLSLVFNGALIYSTIVYFTMEYIEFLPGTNLVMVFLVNIPWTIVPILSVWRTVQKVYGGKKQHIKAQ